MMNIDDVVITEIAGEYVAVPIGDSAKEFKGIIRLNKTGKDILEGLLSGLSEDQIAEMILNKYDITDRNTVFEYIDEIKMKLKAEALIE